MGKEVKAKFDYNSRHEDDLSFSAGQVITVLEEVDDEWYNGEYTGKDGKHHEGMFPRNFVTAYVSQGAAPLSKREGAETKPASTASQENNSHRSPLSPKHLPTAVMESKVKAVSPPPLTIMRESRGSAKDEAASQHMVNFSQISATEMLITCVLGNTR
jgi:myosin tail region-interacting protein MTI1